MTMQQLAKIVNGQADSSCATFSGVSIDGRNITAGDLYVAIKGERFNGHDFIQQAREAGAVGCMVEQAHGDSYVVVPETREALATLARHWRQQFAIPVVAVTGSNGKTTVKELIASVLGQQFDTWATPGNLNNELGVPLTLLKLTEAHQAAVIEMGANHAGEIADLCQIAQPNVAVITNAGAAHLEGFGSLDGVAQAKGEIYQALNDDGIAILNADDAYFDYWNDLLGNQQRLSFGLSEAADIQALNISQQIEENKVVTVFEIHHAGHKQSVKLAFSGKHNVMNALAAAAVGVGLEMPLAKIAQGLGQARAVAGRLQVEPALAGALMINDCYNANPASFEVALAAMQNFPGEHWLVLGDFAELGDDSAVIHQNLAKVAKHNGIQRIFACGELTQQTVAVFGAGAEHFATQAALIAALQPALRKEVVILIKGSRSQRLETVVEALRDESRH